MENDLTGSGLELKCLAGILASPTLSSFLAAPVAGWPRPKAAAEAASVSGWQLLAALRASCLLRSLEELTPFSSNLQDYPRTPR